MIKLSFIKPQSIKKTISTTKDRLSCCKPQAKLEKDEFVKIAKNLTCKELLKNIFGDTKSFSRDIMPGTFTEIKNLFPVKSQIKQYYIVNKAKSTRMKTYYDGKAACFFDENKKLKKVFSYDFKEKDIKVYDTTGKLLKHYSADEVKAIWTYKNDSRNIHKVLRKGNANKVKPDTFEIIKTLKDLFTKGEKLETAKSDFIAYRALDSVSLQKIKNLKEGMIFEDPSFMSVTTKKSCTYQFLNPKNFRYILKIKIQKGDKFLPLDDFHNIIVLQAKENELLLGKDRKLLITKKTPFGIEAELIKSK